MANGRGGYDYSFVSTPPDELLCKICHHPSREPHLSVCCGHTFCRTCLEDAKQVSVDEEAKNTCPMCREKNFTSFPNKRDERAVKSLHVWCTNKDKGCDWQGEINRIADHLANISGCQFEEVNCYNGCGLVLQRQHLSKHVDTECPHSPVTCQYCEMIGERQFISRHHKEKCPKFPLPCPNKCNVGTVVRENMEAHRAECPLELIWCKCALFFQRQCLSEHVDKECPHSQVSCQYCGIAGERHFISKQHIEECPSVPLLCPNKCEVGTILRENTEAHRAECPLETIQCEYYEVGCKDSMARKDQVEHNKDKMEIHLSLMKSGYLDTKNKLAEAEKRFEELEIAMQQRIKCEIQLQQKIQMVENMMFKHVFQWHTRLEERVELQCTEIPVTLKISNYSKKKESDSDWYSGFFSWKPLICLKSNKMPIPQSLFAECPEMKLRVIPAGYGDGKGTHLSLQLYLEQTVQYRKYDSLAWFLQTKETQRRDKEQIKQKEKQELNKKISLTVMNQITDSEHYRLETNVTAKDFLRTHAYWNEPAFDCPCFISNKVLYKSTSTCQYLQDGNIYFLIELVK